MEHYSVEVTNVLKKLYEGAVQVRMGGDDEPTGNSNTSARLGRSNKFPTGKCSTPLVYVLRDRGIKIKTRVPVSWNCINKNSDSPLKPLVKTRTEVLLRKQMQNVTFCGELENTEKRPRGGLSCKLGRTRGESWKHDSFVQKRGKGRGKVKQQGGKNDNEGGKHRSKTREKTGNDQKRNFFYVGIRGVKVGEKLVFFKYPNLKGLYIKNRVGWGDIMQYGGLWEVILGVPRWRNRNRGTPALKQRYSRGVKDWSIIPAMVGGEKDSPPWMISQNIRIRER